MVFDPEIFAQMKESEEVSNQLLAYLQHQSPDILARVAKSASPEIKDIISRNVQGLIGVLPSEEFNVQISTDRENMAGMLASAMMTGYFCAKWNNAWNLTAKSPKLTAPREIAPAVSN